MTVELYTPGQSIISTDHQLASRNRVVKMIRGIKQMGIRGRLMVAFLGCGLIPMIAISFANIRNAQNGSEQVGDHATDDLQLKTEGQLAAIRDLKKSEIVDYFETIRDQVISLSDDRMVIDAMQKFTESYNEVVVERNLSSADINGMQNELSKYYLESFGAEYRDQNEDADADPISRLSQLPDTAVAMQHAYISSNSNPLGNKHNLDAADTTAHYDDIHQLYHPSIRGFLERFGFYDIFMVDTKTGNIVYSVFKELDFATSLIDGPYADTNFGDVFREAAKATDPDAFALVDFECYWPSYEAPASFIASPIYEEGEIIGVLIFQMPVDRINELMTRDAGIGKTGETLLVADDGRQRCDSSRDPENYSLVQAFRGSENRIETDTVKQALAGDTGVTHVENYLGETVISAFSPVNLLGLHWAIVTEVTQAEAFASITDMNEVTSSTQASMLRSSLWAIAIATCLISLLAFFVTRSMVRPIDATVETLRDIAEGDGDLTRRLDENQIGELGQLARNFNLFAAQLTQQSSGSLH